MSNSGYRRRSFGPRGARTNGPTNGFNGPRFPHPGFNHPRPPHRLPGPEKWIERPNFAPWQQNKNFHPHPQYRGNLQFRPNSRGRAAGGRGIVRFSGPGRPAASQFPMGFIRNPVNRTSLPQEEETEDKSVSIPQTPLLGSEEERQQKISETADKLKQKLSSITEEELTNFWEDDLSVLPNNGSEDENIQSKGIPELRHEPPELDLTFTDFRDIGRVDWNNSKFDNVDNTSNDEISITFEQNPTDNVICTNDEITIIHESKEESLIILDSTDDKDNSNHSNILLEDDKCNTRIDHELSDFECNIENLQLQGNNIAEDLVSSNVNDVDEKLSIPNLDENITNLLPLESVNDSLPEKSHLDVNDVETTSMPVTTTTNNEVLKVDFSQNQNITHIQDIKKDIIEDTKVDIQHNNDDTETKVFEDNQIQNNSETDICQETICQNLTNISECSQNKPFNLPSSNEEIHSNVICDSTSSTYSNYSEVHKLNDDRKLNNPPIFQSRVFNIPPRFPPRIGGSRCHWTFQQNGKNIFFRGPQRLPYHANRISPPRHVASFKSADLVPVGFDPRAPPPFTHNVPVSSHDSQHNAIVPFSSNNLPPAFDPSEPPPNIRSKSGSESSNRQENLQPMPPLDLRGQAINISQSNLKVIQPSPAFDPREPPPRISNVSITTTEKVPEFNPQQPPPKIHKREETLQPPPIFDPRLSSQERSSLIAPLDTSRSNMMSLNLMETSSVSDFNIGPITSNFPQLPPINIPSHQTFISNVQLNFQSVISQTSNEQSMMREFPLPLPSMSIAEVPPLPLKESSVEENSNLNQGINMDDGLEDMQEAMEFAKQIMNMTEEIKNENASSTFSELPLTPSEIPVPNETAHSLSVEEGHINIVKKQKKKENKNKKGKQNVVCGPELILEKQDEIETIDEEHSVQNQSKNTEDTLLSSDQIRPKVVFNLNSKTKKIHKPEEWHRIPINIPENKETSQQGVIHNFNKEKTHSRKHSSESRKSNANQNKHQQKEIKPKKNSTHSVPITSTSMHERSNDTSYYHKNYSRDLEKLHPHSSNTVTSNNISTQKSQKSKKEVRKEKVPISESSWKNRVISRFLKMSKNDICNMVNNSSLRKFDIAMKHLVKERRSSLSLELRNTEDEKMKEYDREEFMNQLNAMLDPSAVVGITDLPTEFIHHLSEVLQLEPMPFDTESSENHHVDVDEVKIINQSEASRLHVDEYANEENLRVQSLTEHQEPQDICEELVEDRFLYNKEEPTHYTLNTELNLNISREDTNSSHRSLTNKLNPEAESTHKKQQQPLFNEADLDDILSEVTERTRNLQSANLPVEPEKPTKTHAGPSLAQTVTEAFEYNTFSQIPNKTAADLDDIFSAGIARVKLLSKNNTDPDNLRVRKSTSEDRNTFKSGKYERWSKKEREDPDTFRNLTKEEWEAKYGSTNATAVTTITRKSASNSVENLSKDNKDNHAQRYCSSDSPMRHLSISPLTREVSAHNLDRCFSHSNETEELQRAERTESSSDSSSSSSTDSDEETVASNVTKLLKVIKEKEKIAKKRSLNETIRDEVAAEIEKKWKEKSKYKERKSRKREKKKKDKKEKRRKEKRKKRKRNSYSDSSKSGEQVEGFRLLTEDEIKKEVIVKEEPVNSFEQGTSISSGISNTSVNKSTDSRIELQSVQTENEQAFSDTCDTASSQSKNKSAIASTVVQLKTKAQLKQMPEPNNTGQKQVMEKATEVTKNSTISTGNENMNELLETSNDREVTKNNNERVDTILSTNVSLHQTHVSLTFREPSSSVQSHAKTVSDNNTAHTTSYTYSISNFVTEVSTSNRCEQKPSTVNTCSTENKSGGYKKIDIKAYKERALQRRLKEQAMLKESPTNSSLLVQESHHKSNESIDKSVESSSNVINEVKTPEVDTNKIPLKDPRLIRLRSTSTTTSEDSDKEVKEKISLGECHQPVDVMQKNKESIVSVPSKNSGEKNVTHPVDADSNILKNTVKCKERKSDNKSSSQAITPRELEEFRKKEKAKPESEDKKSKKPTLTVDSSKFKNIRSEGSKELKLKKERAKKANEKKKKGLILNESKSSVEEKSVEKHSHKKASVGNQESLIASSCTTVQSEIQETSSRDANKDLSAQQTVEMCSNVEPTIDSKTAEEQNNTHSIVEQNDKETITDKKESTDTDKKIALQANETITESQDIIDQETIKTEGNRSSISSENEKDNVKEIEKHVTKGNAISVTSSEPTSTETLNKQKDICNDISSNSSISVDPVQSTFNKKCMESTAPLVSGNVNKESHSLSERIDVDNEKNDHSINIKSMKNVAAHNNSVLDTKMDSEAVKSGDKNAETNDAEEQKSTSQLHKESKTSGDCEKIVKADAKSPDSPSSPFKGFLADSIESDICQISQLCHVKVNSINGKENAKEDSNQSLKKCFNDKPIIESAEGDKDDSIKTSKQKKEDSGTKSICNLVEEQQSVTNKLGNNLSVVDNIKIGAKALETENENAREENTQTYNVLSEEGKVLLTADIDSRVTFDEDNEPFIVLDEYIDDVDGKSIEKLSTLDLDFEDTIARDADIFMNKSLQEEEGLISDVKSPNYNSIAFKELSEAFDKDNVDREQSQNNITSMDEKGESGLSQKNVAFPAELFTTKERAINATDIVSSTSESNIESNAKIPKIAKSIDSTISEIPIESSQNFISTTSKDISQRPATPDLSITETKEIEDGNHCIDTSEHNLQHNLESNTTETVVTSLENETSPKLSASIKSTRKTFLENLLVTASASETNAECLEPNKQQELDNNLPCKEMSVPSEIRTSNSKDVSVDSISQYEKPKISNKIILNKLNRKERNEMLHKIKNKPKMKHERQKRDISEKMVKEAIKSDTVKIKYPNTKETIMARMIEIDVEIHKLMTEKMTLYQMWTSDNLPNDNNLQQNNVIHDNKKVETSAIRSRTPSVLMSQLIQNIETSPVKNQCAKTATDSTPIKDNPTNSKTSSKRDHYADRKGSCTSTCGSDDEEVARHVENVKPLVSRKRKRKKSERAVKRLENRLDANVLTKDTQNSVKEKKQADDETKLTPKKVNAKQTMIEKDSDQISANEAKFQKDMNKISTQQIDKIKSTNNDQIETCKYQEVEKIVESIDSQTFTEKDLHTRINQEDDITKDNEENIGTSNEKHNDSLEKPLDNRTPERSSIYSDDSTWDSLLQNSSVDDQKKPNTGLALLEETYRKEMAKTRKIKAEARRKKKKKLQNLLESVNTLTPDEEELPLSTLYIKKLQQKKKLLNSLELQTKQQINDDPQLWKNVVEVINAVAENRAENPHVESLEEQSISDTGTTNFDIPNPLGENSECKENKEKETVGSSTVENIKEICTKPSININITCENKDEKNDDPEKGELQLLPSKSQELLNNEPSQQNLETSVSSKIIDNIPETSASDTTINNEENAVESSIQKTVEINQPTITEDSNSCRTESNLSNTDNDQNVSNIPENPETQKIEDRTGIENKEENLQNKVANTEKNIITEELVNNQPVIISLDVEKNHDALIESNNDKDTAVMSETTSKEHSDSIAENVTEGKSQDSSVLYDKDNNINNATEELNDVSQDEHFISLKDHKESHKEKEIEQFNQTSNEENNNQNCASVSSLTAENTSPEILKSDESSVKKSSKRKRGSSKTPLRRSSRYAEEPAKRIKVEVDINTSNTEQEVQEKNFRMQFPSVSSTLVSPCEEVEIILINPRKSRSTQKPVMNRKRYTPMPPEIEIIHESSTDNESLKGIKRHKKHTMSEMMNCVVRIVDCSHTILKPNVKLEVLQKYGISRVNPYTCSSSTQVDSFVNSVQSTSTKDLSNICTKQTTSLTELPQSQISKLFKKLEDTTRPISSQVSLMKIRRVLKPVTADSPVNNKEYIEPDIEIMPILTKEPITVDITQNCEKPDIEIVEEKVIVTKNQQCSNSGSTLTVIDTKDDKELPRTQYTVHKGPILDIKVFENSFLAASEDGRIYRYNQASNGILNIYKGHKAAVTCLYVHNINGTDICKEWMFSGSLDGTLRCYNIITGVQARETADIGSPIQCMDEAWGIIFIGTKSGHVSRYHMKSGVIKGNSIQFSDKSVLALRATNEGPRRVLIVASRSQPITIRDAQSGLFLRTICGQKSHTVYSLMRDNNLIYCGTSSTSIPVFDFTNGEQTMQYDAGVGIVCMRLYRQLLFAGCYDGNIYVFDTKDHRLICSIPGPGNMLLSMEVIDNKIIAGSKDKRLQSWQMPRQVRSLL